MIRFDFTVSDEDAQNIFFAMQSELNRVRLEASILNDNSPDVRECYRKNATYLEELISKMKNTAI